MPTDQDSHGDSAVLVERRDGVGIVTLNRPDALNAINMAVRRGLTAPAAISKPTPASASS
ncbi:hypothetical protein [Azospirillum sp. INR13]|uniref:hypothetical protein n=1 Tax=Azospirillum sp. INR13 TaxID=2596919 RepID=UPI002106C949|nr:hypothetical protein [Azospirillum sp. INR13]